MSLERLFDKTGDLYKRTEGALNEYREKEITYVYNSSFDLSLRSLRSIDEISIPGYLTKNEITHVVYTYVNSNIVVGDRLKINGKFYEILGISDYDIGTRHNHYKIFTKEVK